MQAAEKIAYPPVKTKPLPENRDGFSNIGYRKIEDGSSPKFEKPRAKVFTEEEQKKAAEDAKMLIKKFRIEEKKRKKEKIAREFEHRKKRELDSKAEHDKMLEEKKIFEDSK